MALRSRVLRVRGIKIGRLILARQHFKPQHPPPPAPRFHASHKYRNREETTSARTLSLIFGSEGSPLNPYRGNTREQTVPTFRRKTSNKHRRREVDVETRGSKRQHRAKVAVRFVSAPRRCSRSLERGRGLVRLQPRPIYLYFPVPASGRRVKCTRLDRNALTLVVSTRLERSPGLI